MNHSELVTSLSEAVGISKVGTDTVLRTLFAEIEASLASGEEVTLLGLGRFKIKASAARKARNPSTGAIIEIPAKNRVVFIPSKSLKEAVQ